VSRSHFINLSSAWEPGQAHPGRAVWVRRFGTPAGLEPGDRVWLVVESPTGCSLQFAGGPLPSVGAGERRRLEVTAILVPRNELVLTAACDDRPPEGLPAGRRDLPATIGRVWLEIEPVADGPASMPGPA